MPGIYAGKSKKGSTDKVKSTMKKGKKGKKKMK